MPDLRAIDGEDRDRAGRRLAAAFLAVRVLGRHDGGRRATRDGRLAAAFLAVRVLGRHDGGRRATRDGRLAAAFLAVRVLGRHDGGRRATRDGRLAAAFLAVRVLGRHGGRPHRAAQSLNRIRRAWRSKRRSAMGSGTNLVAEAIAWLTTPGTHTTLPLITAA